MAERRPMYEMDENRAKDWAWLVESNDVIKQDLQEADPYGRKVSKSRAEYFQICLEMLLENTKHAIAQELNDRKLANLPSEKFYEEIDTGAIVPFTRLALPMIRRVLPRLFARSLFGFQPMGMPDWKVFFFDVKYGTTKYPTTAGNRVDLVANMNPQYGGGRKYLRDAASGGAGQVINLGHYGTTKHKVFIDGVEITAFSVTPGGTPAAQDTLTITDAYTLGAVILIQFEGQLEGQVARDIDVGMTGRSIQAEAIKLRGGTTIEAMQDFAAYHGIQSEVELTNAMAGELEREVDLMLLQRAFFFAGAGNVNWDTAGYLVGDDNTFFRKEYRRTLYEAIVALNNLIYRQRYVDATWIVGGVGAIERLEKLEEFRIAKDNPDMNTIGRRFSGTLNGQWTVYKDARLADNQILMGYSGDTPFHTGAVFSPYIPAYWTDLLPDPSINFKVKKGVMSRFGFEVVIPECYGTLTLL